MPRNNTKQLEKDYQRLLVETLDDFSEILEKKGVTRIELSRRMDVSVQNLTPLFGGERNPSLRTLAKMASAVEMEAVVTFRTRRRAK